MFLSWFAFLGVTDGTVVYRSRSVTGYVAMSAHVGIVLSDECRRFLKGYLLPSKIYIFRAGDYLGVVYQFVRGSSAVLRTAM